MATLIQDFALRLPYFRPIEREYGPATSGESKAASARGLFGSKESGGENCTGPAGSAEAVQSESKEAGGSGSSVERSLALCERPCVGQAGRSSSSAR